MNVEFLSTVAVIAPDPPHSRKLYVDAGQTVARFQSPEGAIVGISYIPMFHGEK